MINGDITWHTMGHWQENGHWSKILVTSVTIAYLCNLYLKGQNVKYSTKILKILTILNNIISTFSSLSVRPLLPSSSSNCWINSISTLPSKKSFRLLCRLSASRMWNLVCLPHFDQHIWDTVLWGHLVFTAICLYKYLTYSGMPL